MSKGEELIKIANSKLVYQQEFNALRDTEAGEFGKCSSYKRENGNCGGGFEYNISEDVLYTLGLEYFQNIVNINRVRLLNIYNL